MINRRDFLKKIGILGVAAVASPTIVTRAFAQELPRVDIVLTSSPVTATPRKLRARWCVTEDAINAIGELGGIDA